MSKLTSILLSIVLLALPLWAERISITAKSFTGEKDRIIYKGDVKVTTESGKEIRCDRLTVYLSPEGKVERIVAAGGVIYKDKKYTATGDLMTYYPKKKEVILEGNAVVKTDRGVLKGDRIVYNIETGSVDVQSRSSVTGVFVIDSEE
ncbi:MAG: hypothetical protein GXO08_01150 [Aquificae bacterium]|nr:hypothetical protein [Aquificota bacterium]